jgi:hypothetical protein
MSNPPHLLYLLIVGSEIAFWLVLLLSLAVRYLLRRDRPSRWLMSLLPVIDGLLLVFAALDLGRGARATFAHGLAAAYVGFTIAFGPLAVRWADAHFAHRFASGPPPPKLPAAGWAAVRFDLELWLRSIVAWAIALSLITGLIAYLGDRSELHPLHAWYRFAFGSVVLWFIFGPLWSLVFFRRRAR